MREMKHGGGHYLRLLGMAALSFVSMYCLMYAMVDRLLLMRMMYPDRDP